VVVGSLVGAEPLPQAVVNRARARTIRNRLRILKTPPSLEESDTVWWREPLLRRLFSPPSARRPG